MMTLFLLIVVIVIVGYFAMNIYRHDNTSFYKLTGYSYLDVLTNKKVRTSYKLVNELEQVKGVHKVLVDLQVPVNDELQAIDALLLHESGIYIINVIHKSGWINGREQDMQWTELLHKEKTRLFENPVHETKRLVYGLQDHLPEVSKELFESVVLFTNDCSFQQVEIHSEQVDVLKMTELKKWTKSIAGNRLSETEIQSLYAALESMMNVKNATLKVNNTIASAN